MTTLREPDLSRCPQCGGIADNGHDRSIPPNPYFCRRCMAQPVQEQMAQTRGEGNCHPPWRCACGANLYIDEYGYPASRAAPARKPVAWLQPRTVDAHSRPDLGYETCSKDDYAAFPVYPALAQPALEPVAADPTDPGYEANVLREQVRHLERRIRQLAQPAPPQQTPLTDEEIDALWRAPMSADWEHREFARAIERAHGIGGSDE